MSPRLKAHCALAWNKLMNVSDSPRARRSLLSMAAWQRLLCAAIPVALLWVLVAWALGGEA